MPKQYFDGDYSNKIVSEIIDEWIHSERDRAILKRKLCDGIIFEKLAEEFDLSVRQVKKIVYKGIDIISTHIYTPS